VAELASQAEDTGGWGSWIFQVAVMWRMASWKVQVLHHEFVTLWKQNRGNLSDDMHARRE